MARNVQKFKVLWLLYSLRRRSKLYTNGQFSGVLQLFQSSCSLTTGWHEAPPYLLFLPHPSRLRQCIRQVRQIQSPHGEHSSSGNHGTHCCRDASASLHSLSLGLPKSSEWLCLCFCCQRRVSKLVFFSLHHPSFFVLEGAHSSGREHIALPPPTSNRGRQQREHLALPPPALCLELGFWKSKARTVGLRHRSFDEKYCLKCFKMLGSSFWSSLP